MGKPAKRAEHKKLVKQIADQVRERKTKRASIWNQISSQEDFEAALPKLKKLYGPKALEKVVKEKGYDK